MLSLRLSPPRETSWGQMSPGHLRWGLNVPCAVGVLAPAMAAVLPGKALRLGLMGLVGPGPWCHRCPWSASGPAPGRGQAGSPSGRAGAAGMVVSSASPRCRAALVRGSRGRWCFCQDTLLEASTPRGRDAPPGTRCSPLSPAEQSWHRAGRCGDGLGPTSAHWSQAELSAAPWVK